jgi:hypothetical protein
MKIIGVRRLIFSVIIILVYLAGCTKYSDPLSESGDRIDITIASPTQITANSTTVNATITSRLNLLNAVRGICWSTSPSPTIAGSRSSNGSGAGTFSVTLSNLSPNTLYYIRAYITTTAGTYYSEERSIRTLAALSIITTTPATTITQTSAITGGQITSDGGSIITERGVCWSTSPAPTIAQSKIPNGSGVGSFSCTLTNLTSNTLYYVRAYAINGVGASYGNQITITTLANLPTLTTASVTSVTQSSAASGGNVTSDGGISVTERGVCWNTSGTPTIANSKVINGAGLGSYSSSLVGLSPNTTYYVRAYATNAIGTAYGNQQIFTTIGSLPTVITNSVTSISQTSAIGNGNVTASGGSTITERGVCWSTSVNPTTANSRLAIGSGLGSFSGSMTSLSPNTTYYVRAYAINSIGTAYGNQINFSTECFLGIPALLSPANGATLGCCNINFSWSADCGATGYQIQVSKSSTFSGTIYTLNTCGNSSFPVSPGVVSGNATTNSFCMNGGGSTNNGIWYWRVRSTNGVTFGTWSSVRSYTYTW